MRRLILLASLCIGCGGPFPGLRWAPVEAQKQSAQVTSELAAAARYTGLPPQSEASRRLASGAAIGATHIGSPAQPVDVSPLLPPAVTEAWQLKTRQIDALQTQKRLRQFAAAEVAAKLSAAAEDIQEQAAVAVKELLPRIQAITDFTQMTERVAKAIRPPRATPISPEEQAAMERLEAALDTMEAAAAAQAARELTAKEVAEKGVESAEDWIGMAGDIMGDYGLLGLIPGAGAIVYAVRKRKQAREQKTEADEAKKDKARAEAKAEGLVETVVKAANGGASS